jgi:hypothetical protein
MNSIFNDGRRQGHNLRHQSEALIDPLAAVFSVVHAHLPQLRYHQRGKDAVPRRDVARPGITTPWQVLSQLEFFMIRDGHKANLHAR